MGFLSGAYGKLMAGKMVRSLQYEMTRVQSQLRRKTREIGNMEKMMSAQERHMKQQMQAEMQTGIFAHWGSITNGADMNNMSDLKKIDPSVMQKFSAFQQQQQYEFSMAQNSWQNNFEMAREAMLEPLKDEEDDLQVEKDNLESRLKLAQAEYDAKKEEEKAGVKGITPEYTGQA